MDRRAALAALALAWPLAVGAQVAQRSATRRRVAFMGHRQMFQGEQGLDAVVKALERRGFADGQRIEVVRVAVDGPGETSQVRGLDYLVPILVAEIRRVKPDVIVAVGSIMAGGLQRATRTIPVVTSVADPVAMGLAASLARPGGNITGTSAGLAESALKTMEFMKLLVPKLERIAIFHDARPMATRFASTFERAAREVGIEPLMHSSFEGAELVKVLRETRARRVQAGLMAWFPPGGDEEFFREAVAVRLPLAGVGEEAAERGALVSYNAYDTTPAAERLAGVVAQVLNGGDPATIPFAYPLSFRLVVNKRTANGLGFTVPPELLLRADRVIE